MSEEFEDLNNDDLNELIEKFEDCLSNKQGCFFDSEEILEVIDYYFAISEFTKTESAINLALQLYPNEIEINIRHAQLISQKKNPQEAIIYLEKFKETNPEDSNLIFALASLYSQAGIQSKAIENYENLLDQDNEDIEVYSSLAEEYFSLNDYESAAKIYKKAIRIEPTNSYLLQPFAYASQYIDNPEKSIIFLRKLCQRFPFSEENWISYGILLYYTEKYFDSITAFELAIAIDEENATPHLYRAQSLIALEDFKKGIEALHEANKLEPKEPLVLFFLAQAYEKQDNWTTAAIYYKKCIKYDQYNSDAWIGVAMCYFEENDFHSAEPYIKKALIIEPNNIHYRLAYAEMLYKENYIEKSEELYQSLYEEGKELSLITINWAMSMVQADKTMDAIHLLRETIDSNDFDEPSIYFTLIEISSKDSYLKDHIEDYVFKLFLDFDISLEMIEKNSPSLLKNPYYENLIKIYIDEKE